MAKEKDMINNWEKNVQLFYKSKDEKEQKEAIGEILKQIGSKRRFNQALKLEKTELSNMLITFENISRKSCQSKKECDSLRKIGKEAKKFTKTKKFNKVVELGFNLATDNIVSFLKLQGGELDNINLEVFYREYLPREIFTQYALLEMMAKNPNFDWNRKNEIIRQTLVLAGMCFWDIYEHIHNLEEFLDLDEKGELEYPDDELSHLSEKNDLYYDAMEWLNEGEPKEAIKILNATQKIDPEYVQTYVGLVAAYRELGDLKNEKKNADIGFGLTKNKFPKWPARMEWGLMENRAFMRSICDKATTSQISGDNQTAEELYRLLLIMNPNDNQGIRYLIAGMLEGITPNDVDRMTDEGNKKQDWSEQEKMVIKQNNIHKFWEPPKD